jgi:hypothetical protein
LRLKVRFNPKNAFIGVGLFFENRQEVRKLGLLPPGESFEAVCELLEPQERKERFFKGQPDIDDFNCIIWVKDINHLSSCIKKRDLMAYFWTPSFFLLKFIHIIS